MTAQPDNTIDEQGDSKSPQLGEQPEQVKSITQARLLPNLAHKLTKKMNDDENNRVVDMAQSTIDDELTAKEILEYFWVDTCKATHNVDSPKFKYRVKKYETLITNLIAQEANKARLDELKMLNKAHSITDKDMAHYIMERKDFLTADKEQNE